MDVAGVVLAAGRGRRLAGAGPRALGRLCGGRLSPGPARAVGPRGTVDQLVVVAPPGAGDDVRDVLAACVPDSDALVVEGGSSRHASLHCGLSRVDPSVQTVVVHDVCRPLAPSDLVMRAVKAVHDGADVAIPVLEVTETVKELDGTGRISRTIPRETLVRVQTPQAFRRAVLDAAHAACAAEPDDDAVVFPPDTRIETVEGADDAFAVVRAHDLAFAEAILARRRAAG